MSISDFASPPPAARSALLLTPTPTFTAGLTAVTGKPVTRKLIQLLRDLLATAKGMAEYKGLYYFYRMSPTSSMVPTQYLSLMR